MLNIKEQIEDINIFIKEFTEKKEVFDRNIAGFSTDSYKYKRLINYLNRLIELEKEQLKEQITQ